MRLLEVFFDYACPFCLRGHEYLTAVLPDFPDVQIVWRPCEAHPRPERYGPHSDLCIQGMYFAQDQGVDLWDYHARMYRAALQDRVDIENPDSLAACVEGLLDPAAFRDALRRGTYAQAPLDGNQYAFGESGVWAVPSYRMEGRKLDALEGIGVTQQQLAAFLADAPAP